VVAVTTGVGLEISLMIRLGRIVSVGVVDLSHDTITSILSDLAIGQSLINFLDHLLRSLLLLRRVSENHGSVLGASIVTLSVDSSRVMEGVEEFNELFILDFSVIKENMCYLDVTSAA